MRDRTPTLDIPLSPNICHTSEPSSSYGSRKATLTRGNSGEAPSGVERLRLQIVDLDAEIERLNINSVQRTRNMLKNIDEAKESGIHALSTLEEQDETLDHIDNDLNQIGRDIGVMRTNLRRMRRFCGMGHYYYKYIRSPVVRLLKGARREKSATWTSVEEPPLVVNLSQRKKIHSQDSFRSASTRKTSEQEIERNLERIEDGVRTLKEVAVDIHSQLDVQRPKIHRIHEMVEENDLNIIGANRSVKKLLYK